MESKESESQDLFQLFLKHLESKSIKTLQDFLEEFNAFKNQYSSAEDISEEKELEKRILEDIVKGSLTHHLGNATTPLLELVLSGSSTGQNFYDKISEAVSEIREMPVDFKGETLAEQIQSGFLQAAEKIKKSLKEYSAKPEEDNLFELYKKAKESILSPTPTKTVEESFSELEKIMETLSDAIQNNSFTSLPLETHPSFGGYDRYIVNLRSSTSSPPDSSSSTP